MRLRSLSRCEAVATQIAPHFVPWRLLRNPRLQLDMEMRGLQAARDNSALEALQWGRVHRDVAKGKGSRVQALGYTNMCRSAIYLCSTYALRWQCFLVSWQPQMHRCMP